MKIKVSLKDQTVEKNLQKIESMLLFDKLSLTNISRFQRISHKNFYIMALRAARGKHDSENYIKCLKILENDIVACDNDKIKTQLIWLLNDSINFAPYNGDRKFELYKKQIKEDTLKSSNLWN